MVVVVVDKGRDALIIHLPRATEELFWESDTFLGKRHLFGKATPFWESDTVLGNRCRFGRAMPSVGEMYEFYDEYSLYLLLWCWRPATVAEIRDGHNRNSDVLLCWIFFGQSLKQSA